MKPLQMKLITFLSLRNRKRLFLQGPWHKIYVKKEDAVK